MPTAAKVNPLQQTIKYQLLFISALSYTEKQK